MTFSSLWLLYVHITLLNYYECPPFFLLFTEYVLIFEIGNHIMGRLKNGFLFFLNGVYSVKYHLGRPNCKLSPFISVKCP